MTDPSIKVSVVIPIYNQEHYLRACLDSLLEQTFTSFEVLAVNDGSTDASAAIVQEYERRDPRFHLIDKPNGGVSAARNTGIAHACGQWIGFIDPDDYVAVDYLQVLYDAATSSDDLPDIVMSTCIACDGARKSRQHFFPEPFTACTPREKKPLYHQLLDGSYQQSKGFVTAIGVPWGKLYLHSFITDNNLHFDPQLTRMEDNLFNIQAFHDARRIMYLDYAGYYYRVSDLLSHTYSGILQGTYHHAINECGSLLEAYGLLDDEDLYRAWNTEQVNLYFQELKAAIDQAPPRWGSVHRAAAQCRRALEARMRRIDNHALARGASIQYAALTNPTVNGAVTGILWLRRYVR